MKLFSLLFLTVLLINVSSPALAQWSGFNPLATGQAQVQTQGTRLSISNLGSSGQDGVRVSMGDGNFGPNGGAVSLLPMSLADFNQEGVSVTGSWGANIRRVRMRIVKALAGGDDTATLEEFPGLATGDYKITIYLNGQEVFCVGSSPTLPEISWSQGGPPSTVRFDSSVDGDQYCVSSKIGGPYVNYDLDIDWILALLITIGNNPPVMGDQVVIESTLPAEPVLPFDGIDVTAGTDDPTVILMLDSASMRMYGRDVRTVGDPSVSMTLDTGIDADCDGTNDESDTTNKLKISNLGSSGCDGVSIDLGEGDSGVSVELAELSVAGPGGGTITACAEAFINGSPLIEKAAEVRLEEIQATGTTRASYSTNNGATVVAEAVNPDGQIGGITTSNNGEIDVLAWSWGPHLSCYEDDNGELVLEVEWPFEVDMVNPATGVTFGRGTVLRMRNGNGGPWQTEMVAMQLMASNPPSCGIQVEGVSNHVSLDGLPPGVPVKGIHSSGGADISWASPGTSCGALMVDNLGSSGCDGVSIAPDESGNGIVGVDWKIEEGETSTDAPDASFAYTVRGRIIDKASPPIMCATYHLISNGTNYAIWPDATPIGASTVQIQGLLNGQVVADVTGSSGTSVAETPDLPNQYSLVAGSGSSFEMRMAYGQVQQAQIGGGNKMAVAVDEIRVIAVSGIGPVASISELDLRVADHEPFVFYDIILLAAGPTSTPNAVPAAAQLLPNYPNPFNPQTTLSFEMPRSGRATLSIYGVDGRRVGTLVDGNLDAGNHQVVWDGTDGEGRRVSSGVYLVKLKSLSGVQSQKVTLIK